MAPVETSFASTYARDTSTQMFALKNESRSRAQQITHEAISLILPDWPAKLMKDVCLSKRQRDFHYNTGVPHSYTIDASKKQFKMPRYYSLQPIPFLLLFLLGVLGCDSPKSTSDSAQNSSTTKPKQTGISSSSSATVADSAKPSTTGPKGQAPEGMVWIPGGVFWMGAPKRKEASEIANDMRDMSDSRPLHQVELEGFWIDETEVTNEQFQKFVDETGYVTIAEIAPKAEDYPGAPPENLVAGSVVFSPPAGAVDLRGSSYQWWAYVPGANWKHPEGPDSTIEGKEKHPVVHVGWFDAVEYATWAKKRLPTEAEWELAARGGLDRKGYVWGDEFRPNNKLMANTFQGSFPTKNSLEDGFATTSPVKTFPPNGYGLYDVAGNVWEWANDWYRPEYFETLARNDVTRNPMGPSNSFDPAEPGQAKRVMKGGSFLCTDQYCSRYMPGGRGKGDPVTGTNHLGFRTVKSPE